MTGSVPGGGLLLGRDGNFYGATQAAGSISTLFGFCTQGTVPTCSDGYEPNQLVQATDGNFYGSTGAGGAGVFQATNGTLYGVTEGGGKYARGTFYSLSMGLAPFVEAIPAFGTNRSSTSVRAESADFIYASVDTFVVFVF